MRYLFVIVTLIVMANMVVGLTVVFLIDQDRKLLNWIREAPHWLLCFLALQAWPLLVWLRFRK